MPLFTKNCGGGRATTSGKSALATPSRRPLVHEAYIRTVDDTGMTWQDRAHFYGIAARVMRRILVDHARARNTGKCSGLERKFALDEAPAVACEGTDEFARSRRSFKKIARVYPRKSEVVELKFFGGLETKEISEVLQISEKTVLPDWSFAKLWLYRALSEDAA